MTLTDLNVPTWCIPKSKVSFASLKGGSGATGHTTFGNMILNPFLDGFCAFGAGSCGGIGLESRGDTEDARSRKTAILCGSNPRALELVDEEQQGVEECETDDCSMFSSTSSSAPDDMSIGSAFTIGSTTSNSFEGANSASLRDLLLFSAAAGDISELNKNSMDPNSLYPAHSRGATGQRSGKRDSIYDDKSESGIWQSDAKKVHDIETSSTRSHAVSLIVTSATRGKFHRSVADKLIKIGENHLSKGEYDKALDSFQRAQFIYSVKLGDDQAESIDAQVRIGRVQFSKGNHESALEAFQLARNMKRSNTTVDKEDVLVAEIWREMAAVHRAKGQHNEALKEMKQALRAFKNVHGEVHSSIASSAFEIASLYKAIGNKRKATVIFSQVLKIQLELYGKVHPEVANTLYELSLLYDDSGDVDKSMKINKKAYIIYSSTVGTSHPAMAYVLTQFGHLYQKLGKRQKAFKAYGRALHIRKDAFGRRHTSVADSLMDIGNLLRSEKQLRQAMQCMNEALNIYKMRCGEDDVVVSDVMNVIGMIHYDLGEGDAAIRLYSQVLQIRMKILGENNPSVANVLNNIGTVYSKNKGYDDAMHAYSTALRIYEKTTGKNHVKYAVTLVNIGTILKNKGEKENAERAFNQALDICRNGANLKDDHPVIQKAIKSLEAMRKANVQTETSR